MLQRILFIAVKRLIMFKTFLSKLGSIPLEDPLALRQAKILQTALAIFLLVAFLDFVYLLIVRETEQHFAIIMSLLISFIITLSASLYLLHRGKLVATILLLSLMLLSFVAILFLTVSFVGKEIFLMALIIPLVLIGLLLERRWMVGFAALTITSMVAVVFIGVQRNPPETIELQNQIYTTIFIFSLFMIVIAAVVDRFGNTLQKTVRLQQQRERELEELSQSLEIKVNEQTADLRAALQQSEKREQELRNALQQIDHHRHTIRQLSVPIIPVSERAMVMPLIGELDQERLDIMTEQALNELSQRHKSRLIVDLTGVTMFDHKVADYLLQLIEAVRLMGSETVIVGVRPELAQSIVATGALSLNLQTERSLQALLS
jgi:rsbT co-antagonist protein RsbR